MSAELQAQVAAVAERATKDGQRVEQPLTSKGISFGRIAADADGKLDTHGVEGVDADLTIRPFGWKGHQATLRDMIEVVVDGEQQRAVAHGATFAAPALLGTLDAPGPFSVVDEHGELLAVYERRGAGVKPTVVLAPQASQ